MWIVFLRVKEGKKISLQCARIRLPKNMKCTSRCISEAITVPSSIIATIPCNNNGRPVRRPRRLPISHDGATITIAYISGTGAAFHKTTLPSTMAQASPAGVSARVLKQRVDPAPNYHNRSARNTLPQIEDVLSHVSPSSIRRSTGSAHAHCNAELVLQSPYPTCQLLPTSPLALPSKLRRLSISTSRHPEPGPLPDWPNATTR